LWQSWTGADLTAIDFPPMQKGASFNLQAVKEQVEAAIAKGHPGD
jgi:hypothetical protein